jgi:hypothetical protein
MPELIAPVGILAFAGDSDKFCHSSVTNAHDRAAAAVVKNGDGVDVFVG